MAENQINLHKYIIYLLVFIIVSCLTFIFIYKISGQPAGLFIFTTFPVKFIISLLILLFLYFLCDALRLYFVLKTLHILIDLKEIFKLVFINIFISNITPFASGGGFAQVYFLNKRGVPLGNATAATTLRTVLAAVIIFISTPLILLSNKYIFLDFSHAPVFLYLLILTVLYVTFFYIAIFRNRFIKKLIYIFLHFIYCKNIIKYDKYKKWLKYLFKHIQLFGENLALFVKGNIWHIILSILFTGLFLLAEFTFSIILLTGMGYEINYLTVIFMQVIVVFFMYFAPTPGATGVAEGGYSLLFSRFVEKNDLLPLIFSWRFFTKYIGIGLGIIIFFTMLIKGDNNYEK